LAWIKKLATCKKSKSRRRNQHLVAVIKELLAKKERIFAIMGSSHAVCVAPSFQRD
jgi:hypothetical protein